MSKKNIAISAAILAILGLVSYFAVNNKGQESLGGVTAIGETLIGSSSNAKSLPNSFVESDYATASTTLAGLYLDGGGELKQTINTGGVDAVRLNVMAVGGTATSTLFVRQQASQDGTNWFNIHASSTPTNIGMYTSSTVLLIPTALSFDPGTATTSFSFVFDTQGAQFTRFLFYGDDLTADSVDGVQAWIQAIKLQSINH